jgi:hypothetical protein
MTISRTYLNSEDRPSTDNWRDSRTDVVMSEPANAESSASYVSEQTSEQAGERWQRIQSEFVDDPRRAVHGAHDLVSEIMQRVIDTFSHEREQLEQQWSGGDEVSTEDLRLCMQRYRAFFSRLLPFDEQAQKSH